MTGLLPLLLLSSQVATSSAAARLGDRPFTVEADRLMSQSQLGRYRAEGDVVVRRPGATLFADVVTFDETTGVAIAEGHVTAVEGGSVLTCERIEMKIPELLGGMANGELRIKKSFDPKLADTLSPGALRRHGDDELIIEAASFERRSERVFEVEGGSFTACDCGDDSTPTWRIRASRASVDLDSGAWLEWPVFYVQDLPFLALPAYYVPLGSRRTGLLAPRPSFSAVTGPAVALPFYLTLGRSWDMTFEPAYLSTRGPALGLELRYAPSTTTSGTWSANTLLDFGQPDGDGFTKSRSFGDEELSPLFRASLTGRHVTDFDDARLHLEVNAVQDPRFLADFADAFLSRQQELARSRATVTSASEHFRIAGAVQWLQDLRAKRYVEADQRETELFSNDVPGAGSVRQRLVELRLDAAPYPVTSAVPLIGDAGFSLQAFAAPSRAPTRFARVDFRPQVRMPLELAGVVVEPYLAARVTAWAGSTGDRSVAANRQALLAGGQVFFELSRLYETLYHRIRPSFEYLAIPIVSRSGDDVFATYDEIDLLAEVSQARLRLVTELLRARDGLPIAALDVWFGGDLGLPGGTSDGASEIVAEPSATIAPVGWPVRVDLSGLLAYDPNGRGLTEVLASFALRSPRGDALTVSFGELAGGTPPRHTFIAPEELVPSNTIDRSVYVPLEDFQTLGYDDRLERVPWSSFRGLALGAQVRPFEPLTIGFDITLSFEDEVAVYGQAEPPSVVRSTRALVKWDSPCDCLSAYVTASKARDRPGYSFDFGLDLARLGGISTP